MVPCNTCGQLIDEKETVCPYCGLPQKVKRQRVFTPPEITSSVAKKPKTFFPWLTSPFSKRRPQKKKGCSRKALIILVILISLCVLSSIVSTAIESAWNRDHPVEATVKALDQAATKTEQARPTNTPVPEPPEGGKQ